MSSTLVIATRESRLALWQAEHVRELLRLRLGRAPELLAMTTQGDTILDRTLAKVGGKGLFVKELEAALADGRAQLAVHSLKDVPMDLPPGFALAAVLEREDPRDAFVSNRHAALAELPHGASVGTSSLRRIVQLRALRPDLRIVPLRGNLDTRLRKLDEGLCDAIVLAAAGLKRLGAAARIRALFEPAQMVPCAGQGALAIEVRDDAADLRGCLALLAHRPTAIAVAAERAVSRTLGGSCSMPLAAHATWRGDVLVLDAALGHPQQTDAPLLRASEEAPAADEAEAEALGRRAAAALQQQGASAYLTAAA
jgi:hydroxymethylbilane synthase